MGLPRVQYNSSNFQDTLVTELPSSPKNWLQQHYLKPVSNYFSRLRQRLLNLSGNSNGWTTQILRHLHLRVHSPALASTSDSILSTQAIPNISLPRSSQSLDTSVSSDFVSGGIGAPQLKLKSREEFIDELIADKAKFDSFVYTKIESVSKTLEQREHDLKLRDYVKQSIPNELLKHVEHETKSVVFFRHLVTPNFETHRFMSCVDVMSEFRPVIFELTEDKFTDVNVLKRALGKLTFYSKLDRNNTPIVRYKSVLDMSKCNGLKICDIKTTSGHQLVDFHRKFFLSKYPEMANTIVDVSKSLKCSQGETATNWYKHLLSLFLQNGFLLENFLTEDQDLDFTKRVFLPAFITLIEETGYKPLIVALEPTKIEGSAFWHSYPESDFAIVTQLLNDTPFIHKD